MSERCSHVRASGARCQKTAGEGGTCARHAAGYVARASKVEPAQPSRLLSERGVDVWHADWRELAEVARAAGGVDAVIVDAPYSARTHAGHDDGTAQANRVADWAARERARGRTTKAGGASLSWVVQDAADGSRRSLTYAPWTDADVAEFVATWAPLCRGWFVSLTDHELAPAWASALEDAGRYVFSPIACVEVGSRFRATGDGHSQWSCWAVVARPSSGAWLSAWRERRRARGAACALRGAYIVGEGDGDARSGRRDGSRVPGGKPLSMVRWLVDDHSEPGDLIADPTCGGGTLGEACIAEGRRALLGDRDEAHARLAAERCRTLPAVERKGTLPLPWEAA